MKYPKNWVVINYAQHNSLCPNSSESTGVSIGSVGYPELLMMHSQALKVLLPGTNILFC